MLTPKERLQAVIRYYGRTQEDFAAHIGTTQGRVSACLSRERIPLTLAGDILLHMKEISPEWLIFGWGTMLKETARPNYYSELIASCGDVEYAEADCEPICINIPGVKADAYFPAGGSSMEPTIYPGDLVGVKAIEPNAILDPDKLYFILTNENQRMIKHIQPSPPDDDTFELSSDNPKYRPFRIRKDSVLKIYQVTFIGHAV